MVTDTYQDPPAISANLMSKSTNRDTELLHRLDMRRIDDQALDFEFNLQVCPNIETFIHKMTGKYKYNQIQTLSC